MAVNGNATAIEIPVTLGLKTATEQIEFLRKLLNETMKPNTAAYNEISKLLDKAAQSATRLKGSMSDSFKSSAESKRFGNDVEKTFNMIKDPINDLSSDFVLGIANAIAIDVEWKSKFDNCHMWLYDAEKRSGIPHKKDISSC